MTAVPATTNSSETRTPAIASGVLPAIGYGFPIQSPSRREARDRLAVALVEFDEAVVGEVVE
ncbi:MAG: hypothetical protein ABEH83_02135, partial [Halobacterium sp.]